MNKKKRFSIALGMVVVLLMAAVIFNVNSKKAAKACGNYGDKQIKISKCKMTLNQKEYEWDGTEKCPELKISYKGKELVKDVDYTVKYENNKDAGKAKVEVTGMGIYTGKKATKFRIKGIKIKECAFEIKDDTVYVYNNGKLLDSSCYSVTKKHADCAPEIHGSGDRVARITAYHIYGKGQYEGKHIEFRISSYIEE